MKIITGTANIDKAITSIATRGAKFSRDVHTAATSCLAHIEEHGDVTLLTRLYKAMPKGVKSKSLIAWAEAFGKVTWDQAAEDKKTGTKGAFVYDKAKATDIDGAKENPTLEYQAAKTEVEYDLGKKALAFAKGAIGEEFSDADILAAVKSAMIEAKAAAAKAAKNTGNVVSLKKAA